MHKPDSVEAVLSRLIPSALSEGSQSDIEAMIDDLAGTPVEGVNRRKSRMYWVGGSGIAAAGVAALLVFQMASPAISPSVSKPAAIEPELPNVVMLDESDRIESMTDEGWQEDFDGTALRAMRLSAVQENRMLDEETGIVVRISQPRVEMLLMPVSTF